MSDNAPTHSTSFLRAETRLKSAMARAIALFELTFDKSLQCMPNLEIVDDPKFRASVRPDKTAYRVVLNAGIVDTIDAQWKYLWDSAVLCKGKKFERLQHEGKVIAEFSELTDLSLVWLCLHELMHFELNHFTYVPSAELVEVGLPENNQETQVNHAGLSLSSDEEKLLDKCLEMQADSEASDIFLGLYSDTRWDDLRVLAVCIFVVMAVIEHENTSLNLEAKTHPGAGTRFFMLVGHMFQMWRYPNAHLEQTAVGSIIRTPETPNDERLQGFIKHVLVPLTNDAVMVAASAEAASFLADIGGHGAIFRDIFKIQHTDDLSADDLLTKSAKEWLHLLPLNERLMAFAGHR